MWQQPFNNQQARHGLKSRPLNAKVVRGLFFQTGTYNDQMRRPLSSANLSNNAMLSLEVATKGGTNLTRAAVAGVAADIIRPKAEHEGIAHIDQGWGESRASFMLEFAVPLPGGVELRKIITGYTNYLGIAGSGAIDPQMVLYINTISTLRTSMHTGPGGRVIQASITGNDTLLTGHFTNGGAIPNDLSLRPLDIYTQMSSSTDLMGFAGEGITIDSRATFGAGPVLSERGHTFNASYVSKMLEAAQKATILQRDGVADMSSVYREAAGLIGERTMASDVILDALAQTGDRMWTHGGVSWGKLVGLFPDIDSKTTVVFSGGAHARQNAMPHQRGQTEHWQGSGQETVIATQVAQTVPGLMMENMIGNIGIMITNNTVGGLPIVTITREPLSLTENVDLHFYVERFKQMLLTELVPGITFNNNASLTVNLTSDIFGETYMSISFNGYPPVDFASPTFCDNRFSSLVTVQPLTLDNIKRDFQNIIANIGHGSDVPSHISHPFSSQFAPAAASTNQFMPSMQPALQSAPIVSDNKWK